MTVTQSGDLTVERRCAASIIVPAPPQPTTARGTRLPRGRRAGGLVQQQDAPVTVQAPGQWKRRWLGWWGGGWSWLACGTETTIVITHGRSATWAARGNHHSPRDGDALPLAARQRGAPLFAAIRQGTDELVRVGQPGSPPPPTARMPAGVGVNGGSSVASCASSLLLPQSASSYTFGVAAVLPGSTADAAGGGVHRTSCGTQWRPRERAPSIPLHHADER
jgi:hypothetical protein